MYNELHCDGKHHRVRIANSRWCSSLRQLDFSIKGPPGKKTAFIVVFQADHLLDNSAENMQ